MYSYNKEVALCAKLMTGISIKRFNTLNFVSGSSHTRVDTMSHDRANICCLKRNLLYLPFKKNQMQIKHFQPKTTN